MAYLQMNFFSHSLMRTVPVNLFLPTDCREFAEITPEQMSPWKTLYLLHGVFGNYTDWLNNSLIQRYAQEKNIVVVMPSGDNAFYVDEPASHNFYGRFIGQELVEFTRKLFPLSSRREDTWLGGLSMGGFGALRNTLNYPETFGAVIALSSALITDSLMERTNDCPFFPERRDFAERIFGDLSAVAGSENDPVYLARRLKEQGTEPPEIFMACGEQDSLLPANRRFAKELENCGFSFTFITAPGGHDWDFWDAYLKKGLDWLFSD